MITRIRDACPDLYFSVSHMEDLKSGEPGRVGSGLGLDLIRVEVLPALREPRPALGLQSQLGPEVPELVRVPALPPPCRGRRQPALRPRL